MQFDKTELTVAPGQLVEIVFTNPDAMQHNFVLGQPDSLKAIGQAADDLARTPNGPAQQYVPQIPQILFSTKLVEPGETVTVQFKAPAEAGAVSIRLHVPGPLARDERAAERARAAGRGGGAGSERAAGHGEASAGSVWGWPHASRVRPREQTRKC